MNQNIIAKQRQGMAIALRQFPELKDKGSESGIYIWQRQNEEGEYCWYIGKAKNLLRRTAQHIVDAQSHLDKSIKKHGFFNKEKNPFGWEFGIIELCSVLKLDETERRHIKVHMEAYPNSKTYNVESGGTTGKTIIGEKKQRRDVKWKAEARAKVIAEYREYFDIVPNENAIKGKGELKAEPKKLKGEYYANSN